jgi:putative isomerase
MRALTVAIILFASSASAATPAELSQFLSKSHSKAHVIKPAKGLLKHSYIVPAGPYYQLFDWDMYFMSVALSYDKVSDPVIGSVEDFLEYVDEDSNDPGYAPREIAPDRFWALPEQCKPFMAQAAVRASQTRGDWEWARKPYEKLKLMVGFWESDRRASDGLFVWYNGEESGADNNPAVSDDPSLLTEGVDLQAYLYREYLALARLATKLGYADQARDFAGRAEDLRKLVIARMWNEADGMFYNINSRSGEQLRILTWTGFTPLWAKMLSLTSPQEARMADRLFNHLLSGKEFWAPFGVRSVAKTEPTYDPANGYWQGPVWTLVNWMMAHALADYGRKDRALELAQKAVDLLVSDFKKTGGMNECYNPETGQPTAAGDFVSWSLLAEHLVDEIQTGKDPADLGD